MTVLAVSHRAVAIERADQVLRLAGGRLVADRPQGQVPASSATTGANASISSGPTPM